MESKKKMIGECDLAAEPDCSEPTPTELQVIRRDNLGHVIEKFGGPAAVATMLGYKSGSILSQLTSPNSRRTISRRRCREYEMVLLLRTGYLDNPRKGIIPERHSRRFWEVLEDTPRELICEQVISLILTVGHACDEDQLKLQTSKFAGLVALVMADSASNNFQPRPEYVSSLITLAK